MNERQHPPGDPEHGHEEVARAESQFLVEPSHAPGRAAGPVEPQPATQPLDFREEARRAAGVPREGPRASSLSLATLGLGVILSLISGGAGAWAYLTYLAPPPKPEAPATAAADAASRLDEFSWRLDKLRKDVEALPPARPAAEFAAVAERVSRLEGRTDRLDALAQELKGIPASVEANLRAAQTNKDSIEQVRGRLASLSRELEKPAPAEASRPDAAEPRPKPETSPATPAREGRSDAADPTGEALGTGVAAIEQGRYPRAFDTFQGLTRSRPDDARAWYLAAVSRGLATGDWRGETEQLARRGAELEKAGTPARELIDSALKGLTTPTGKDWIAYFRAQAR